MKKSVIVISVILLVALALLAVGFLYLQERQSAAEVTDPSVVATEPPTEPATEPEVTEPEVTEPATEPEATEPTTQTESTEPPAEPEATEPETAEPAFVLEAEASWSEVAYGWELAAEEYFVYDLDADKFLTRSGDVDMHLYPASITKLFTCLVALQILDPEEEVTVGEEVWLIDAGSSVAKLKKYDVLTVEQLIGGLLMPSGNDAAQVLAVAAGRKLADEPYMDMREAIKVFVEEMNTQAELLGLTESHFTTVDGIHSSNHYIGMQDMATIGKMALENEIIAKHAGTDDLVFQLPGGRYLEWENTNEMLHDESEYYCAYITGLKTGFTTPAGYCLLSSVQVGERNLLIGVFGCEGKEDRFSDTMLLFMRTFQLPIQKS